MKRGDLVRFVVDSENADWTGEPAGSRLCFSPCYKPNGRPAKVNRVARAFFYTTAFLSLHAPVSAVKVYRKARKK